MENLLFESPYNSGYSRGEWSLGWNKVKEPNVYEVDFFGDLLIPAIACGLKKMILIFHTNLIHPRSPIEVVDPSTFGSFSNSHIPIILAYNLSHYESLHTIDDVDMQRCKDLIQQYKNGEYMHTYIDLSLFVSLDNIPIVEKDSHNISKEPFEVEEDQSRSDTKVYEDFEQHNDGFSTLITAETRPKKIRLMSEAEKVHTKGKSI